MLEQYYEFQLEYKRKPDSWRDWRHGMATMHRQRAAQEYTTANAMRLAMNADKDGWMQYLNRLRIAAGLTRK